MFRDVEGKIMCLYKSAQRKNQNQNFGLYGNMIYHHLTFVEVVKHFSPNIRN
jgi:hypothetical protein